MAKLEVVKPIFNFFRYWKKHGWKKTKSEFKEKYIMLETPLSSLKKEMYGHMGTMGGLLLAIVLFISQRSYKFTLLLAAGLYLNWTYFKRTLKQIETLKQLQEDFGGEDEKENTQT